jgi:hypothetical protein
VYFRCSQKLRAIHELLCWKVRDQELTGQWLELKHVLKRSNIERILSPDRSVCVDIVCILTVKCIGLHLLALPCQSPLVPVLCQMSLVHTSPSYFFRIYFISILSSISVASKRYPSLRFSHKTLCACIFSLACIKCSHHYLI